MATWDVDPTQATSIPSNRVQTGPELNGLLVANDTIRFKAGYFHDGCGTYGFLQSYLELDNLTITSFGTGDKPALDPRIWLPPGSGGWTLVRSSGGVKAYRKLVVATATAPLRRVWVDAINGGIEIGARTAGAGIGRPPTDAGGLPYDILSSYTLADEETVLDRLYAAYAAQGRIWCSLDGSAASDKVVYMLVPSAGADTPDDWYSGLAVLQLGTGTTIGAASPRGLRLRNCAGVLIDGLEIGGSDAAIKLDSGTTKANSNFTVQNCSLTYWWSRGIQVLGAGSYGNSAIIIQDNVLDAKPTADEQDTLTGAGWFHSAESIECLSSEDTAPLSNLRIRRNLLSGLQHNAMNVATRSDSGGGAGGSVTDIQIEFNEINAEDYESDVRGMAIQGISGSRLVNLVRGNVIRNCCTTTEFSGQLTVSGNWWLGHRPSESQSTIVNCVQLGPNGARNTPTTDLRFEYNQILACQMTPIRIVSGQEYLPAGAITATRNILQMVGTLTDICWNVRNTIPASGDFAVDAVRILNNHVERTTEPTIYWRTTGTGAQTAQSVTAGPSGGTRPDAITYTGNTYGTRLSSVPTAIYPPSTAVDIFG